MKQAGVVEGRETNQPGAVRIPVQHGFRELEGEPRLAGATRPSQCDQPRFAKKAAQLRQLSLAPHKGAELGGQVVRCGHLEEATIIPLP